MSIGEFSKRSGLSPKRLRSYASAGLLVPAAVDSGSGYRYYVAQQLRDAQLIDALRGAGVPLADIATVLRDRSGAPLDVWAGRVQADAARRHAALREARRLLAVDADSSNADGPECSGRDEMMMLRTAARTDIGRVRPSNQDAVLCLDHLVAIADGMGGPPAGEMASSLALAVVEAAFTGRSSDELEAAVRGANRAIFERAAEGEDLEGMGTTLCAVGLTRDGRLAVVNVGDSRAYLLRDGELQRLTDDHSVVADLVRRGELTESEARHHPHRSVLTRAVGVGPTVEVDTAAWPAGPGDRVLLCTDGLTNEVRQDQIVSVLETTDDLAGVADALVELALANGGNDNVAVVVADIAA
jgi:PPM family protein phosphatase